MDEALLVRIREYDVDPSGPLWGEGELLTRGEPGELERKVDACFPAWAAGLAAAGLRQERRPLRLRPAELDASFKGDVLQLAFELPAGAYATAVLRELVDWDQAGG